MALTLERHRQLGDELFEALRTRRTLDPLSQRIEGIDIDDAYRISLHFLDRRIAAGERVIGKKIGDSVQVNTPGGGKSYEVVSVVFR